jgi:hypothetical protein
LTRAEEVVETAIAAHTYAQITYSRLICCNYSECTTLIYAVVHVYCRVLLLIFGLPTFEYMAEHGKVFDGVRTKYAALARTPLIVQTAVDVAASYTAPTYAEYISVPPEQNRHSAINRQGLDSFSLSSFRQTVCCSYCDATGMILVHFIYICILSRKNKLVNFDYSRRDNVFDIFAYMSRCKNINYTAKSFKNEKCDCICNLHELYIETATENKLSVVSCAGTYPALSHAAAAIEKFRLMGFVVHLYKATAVEPFDTRLQSRAV